MLNQYCTVYVPTTIHDKPAPVELVDSIRAHVKKNLAQLFGGFTETIGQGGWYSDELNTIIEEKIYLVKAYAETIDSPAIEKLETLAAYVKTELDQEAVSLEINSTLRFI